MKLSWIVATILRIASASLLSERADAQPGCDSDNVLRALRNPTNSASASLFCSSYILATETSTKTSTSTVRTTSTSRSTAHVISTVTQTSTETSIITSLSASSKQTVTNTITRTSTKVTKPTILITSTLFLLSGHTVQSTLTSPVVVITDIITVPTHALKARRSAQLLAPAAIATYPAGRISSACSCFLTAVPTSHITVTITQKLLSTEVWIGSPTKTDTSFTTVTKTSTHLTTTTQAVGATRTATANLHITSTITITSASTSTKLVTSSASSAGFACDGFGFRLCCDSKRGNPATATGCTEVFDAFFQCGVGQLAECCSSENGPAGAMTGMGCSSASAVLFEVDTVTFATNTVFPTPAVFICDFEQSVNPFCCSDDSMGAATNCDMMEYQLAFECTDLDRRFALCCPFFDGSPGAYEAFQCSQAPLAYTCPNSPVTACCEEFDGDIGSNCPRYAFNNIGVSCDLMPLCCVDPLLGPTGLEFNGCVRAPPPSY